MQVHFYVERKTSFVPRNIFLWIFSFLCCALGSPFGSAKLDESKILVEAEKDNFIWATAGSTRIIERAKNTRQLTIILFRYIILLCIHSANVFLSSNIWCSVHFYLSFTMHWTCDKILHNICFLENFENGKHCCIKVLK